MSTLTVDHQPDTTVDHEGTVENQPGYDGSWDDLVRIWEETDAPEGCKVEIIEGIITVSPSPGKDHNGTAAKLQRRLYSALPEDWEIYQTLGVCVPERQGLLFPDLVVVPDAAMEGPGNYIPAEEAQLIVEITSPRNAKHDRVSKLAAYAYAGVPLYLLIDAWAPAGPTVTLHEEPEGDAYRVLRAVKFGDEIRLPAPFDLTIDTGQFPVR